MQAPRQRGQLSPETERRTRLILYAVAALGFLGLAAAIGLFALGGDGGGGDGEPAAIRSAGCTLQTFPGGEAAHVEKSPERSTYNSFPPTSGPHNPTPAPFDVYSEPVEQYRLLHNLEHGALVIQYGPNVPSESVEEFVAWYRDDPNGVVIAPLPELKNRIALAAWTTEEGKEDEPGKGVLAKCPRFDEGAFDAFKDAYAFRGPERFPRDLLEPGT